MKIYTTYFAKVSKLPKHITAVSIASKDPHPSFSTNKYKELCPPWYVLKAYKENGDKEQYVKDYQRLVLSHLNPHEVVKKLQIISGYNESNDVALVCYEKSSDFCHRHLVSEWLRAAGYEVEEWTG